MRDLVFILFFYHANIQGYQTDCSHEDCISGYARTTCLNSEWCIHGISKRGKFSLATNAYTKRSLNHVYLAIFSYGKNLFIFCQRGACLNAPSP